MNYKKEIAPLPEGFADAISRTINKLQHMQEAPASRKSDRSDGDTKPQDISGEEEKVSADKKAPARKGDKSQGEAMASVKEEVEALEEVRNIKIAKDGKDEKMVNKQELKTYLQMGWKEVKEEAELDEATITVKSFTGKAPAGIKMKKIGSSSFGGDDVEMTGPDAKLIAYAKKSLGCDKSCKTIADVEKSLSEAYESTCSTVSSSYKPKAKKEEIDAVNPKAVKKKFDDRKDKDIDNDGDEDESDEYLHKRRKAISKALSKDESVKKPNASVDESAELEGLNERFSPREIKMAIGIASDKRYAGGNMTGAVKAIDKLKKGLSDHPQVSAVLKRQNEETELDEALQHVHTIKITADAPSDAKPSEVADIKNDFKLHVQAIRGAVKRLGGLITDTEVPSRQNKFVGKIKIGTRGDASKISIPVIQRGVKSGGIELDKRQFVREEVELDEARPPQIQKGKAKGTISATGIRGKGNKKFDVMVGFDNGKFSFRITDESGRFQTVGMKQASKMLGEESVADLTEAKLNEAKNSDYTIYHKTFSSAVQHAIAVAKKRGYAVDEDDWDRKVAMGPRKPSKGKTNSYSINLSKNGKDVRQKLQMQVYYDQGRYELNMYIS
jgi:hypothetical protein